MSEITAFHIVRLTGVLIEDKKVSSTLQLP